MAPEPGAEEDEQERADHGQGPHPAGPERDRALVADERDARGDRPQAPPGRGDQAGFPVAAWPTQAGAPPRRGGARRGVTQWRRKRSGSTTSRRRRRATGTASGLAVVPAPARARRRARGTRVSRHAPATMAPA